MTRILALLLLVVLVALAARRLMLHARRSPLGQLFEALWRARAVEPPSRSPERERPASAAGALRACDGCGVHVPLERLRATPEGRLCQRCLPDPAARASSRGPGSSGAGSQS